MEWLPGHGVFRDHTPALWLNVLTGGVLGYVVTRLRAAGTKFEGSWAMAVLGTTAGLVLGVTIFAFFGLFVLLVNFGRGATGTVQVIVLSLLAQMVAFAVFAWRRR
jgi:hypothetical protein